MKTVDVETLSVIVANVKTIGQLWPDATNANAVKHALMLMTPHQIGCLSRAIEQVVINGKALGRIEVQVPS